MSTNSTSARTAFAGVLHLVVAIGWGLLLVLSFPQLPLSSCSPITTATEQSGFAVLGLSGWALQYTPDGTVVCTEPFWSLALPVVLGTVGLLLISRR
ncbi:hypothetical protein [Natronocalculus amylovorans]|uniref:Uncharacterized protein n=1 Tax=Natronocalculus amylovorans TaxID=2917812 RepID=A0AAE3FYN8_9EURY|nr:hypothetical protein [Natronocalculus amylovorans]MCL9817967.1 hypothetical protein [Natronocalculus amylovorans]NUE03099.1 hypothetical protein [Halorubraceae archaeon YAN]